MLKVPNSVANIYQTFVEDYTPLQKVVLDIVKNNVLNENWLFKSRIKTKESYYYKLQTGRIEESKEDILACTLVVENVHQIAEAEKSVSTFFNLLERRPPSKNDTNNSPELFSFDDLRLYLSLKGRDIKSYPGLEGLVFEMQIKTFLQHAWTLATHDLIYKPKEGTDWAMARVAYQIRAMLEHAEVSIEQVKDISRSSFLAKENKKYKNIKYIEKQLAVYWPDGLGNNVKRLSESILRLSSVFECDKTAIFRWIKEDTSKGLGANLHSFSPYEIALEAIIEHLPGGYDTIKSLIEKKKSQIFVPHEFLERHITYSDVFFTLD